MFYGDSCKNYRSYNVWSQVASYKINFSSVLYIVIVRLLEKNYNFSMLKCHMHSDKILVIQQGRIRNHRLSPYVRSRVDLPSIADISA